MSDGMSDSRAEERLAGDVWRAAFDLREAAVTLCKAIQRARMGHRGWGLPRSWVVGEVNRAMERTGFFLADKSPEKSFEHYDDAYDPAKSWREKRLEENVRVLRDAVQRVVTESTCGSGFAAWRGLLDALATTTPRDT